MSRVTDSQALDLAAAVVDGAEVTKEQRDAPGERLRHIAGRMRTVEAIAELLAPLMPADSPLPHVDLTKEQRGG